jgi:hypothetical protein
MLVRLFDSGILYEEQAILLSGIGCSFLHLCFFGYFSSIRLDDMAIGIGSTADLMLKSAV